MKRLDGKRVVITGAASGLGRALALALARKGCRIGVVDVNTDGARETLRLVERAGGTGEVYELDVRMLADWETMAGHFFDSWGGVDVLVNNAGVTVVGGVGYAPIEDWEWIYSINLWGVIFGCHTFVPRLKAQGGGYIVNMASALGLMGLWDMAPYNTAKAAVISLSETLRMELSSSKIGVTVVCPTFTKTGFLEDMRCEDEFWSEATYTAFENARMSADEVAEAAVRAIERRKLYVVPQLSGRMLWRIKRVNPGLYHRTLAFLTSTGIWRSVFTWLVRKGLL
jgi:NAD(P)-dependent dehydrogenase (short-subunit alcohol dehydrogenase family)